MSISKNATKLLFAVMALAVITLVPATGWASPAIEAGGVETAIAAAGPAGSFEGEYSSNSSGTVGKLRIQLKEEAGNWSGEVAVNYNGVDLPCKVLKVEVKDNQLTFAFSTEAEGAALQVVLSGTLTGDNWAGTFQATALSNGSPMDSGSWKAARK